MKKPMKDGKTTKEKANAGAHKPSGINKPMVKESVNQRVARNTTSDPTQKQKL